MLDKGNEGTRASSRSWTVRQILKDPEDDNSYQLVGTVDLDASDEAGEVRLSELRVEH